MALLVDTSILVRTTDRQDAGHDIAVRCLESLRSRGERLVVAPQNIVEFWAVATRPRSARGLGLRVRAARAVVSKIIVSFMIQPEGPAIFGEWLRLVDVCAVSGKQAHDARLAAWMRVHEIAHILTFNVDDFKRYPGISPVHPQDIAPDQF